MFYSWIGLPVPVDAHKQMICQQTERPTAGLDPRCTNTKNQFPNEPEGLRQFRDQRWKALGEKIQIFWVQFCIIIFWPLIFQNMLKLGLNKVEPKRTGVALPNTPMLRGLRSIWGALVCAGIDFYVVKEVKLICLHLIISCSRVPAIFSYACINLLVRYQKSLIANWIYARNALPTH